MAIVAVIALVAGGAYFWTQRDDSSTDTATKAGATTTSAATNATPTTSPTWTVVTDQASGLVWKLPTENVASLPSDMPAGLSGPFTTNPTAWSAQTKNGAAADAQILIWAPSMGATQATVDEFLGWNHDMYRRVNTPYAKALTVAGQPATVVDASADDVSMLEAVAAVDGSLVVIDISAYNGANVDPAVFEKIVASFTKR